jgi:hypothetical protein
MDYPDAQALFDALSAPFPAESIDWRIGSTNSEKTKGMALAYIDARAVMDRLDTVCGPDAWQCRYDTVNGSAVCNLGIKMPSGEWLWKADGAGQTDVEGEKGALSDALKRSAVRWGVGRYLYDMKAPWVAIEPMGRSFKIADAERVKLDNAHEEFAQKAGWGLRAGVQAYKLLIRLVDEFVTDAASADEFREKNKGMIPQLPVAMRRHLEERLDRKGATQAEAAE